MTGDGRRVDPWWQGYVQAVIVVGITNLALAATIRTTATETATSNIISGLILLGFLAVKARRKKGDVPDRVLIPELDRWLLTGKTSLADEIARSMLQPIDPAAGPFDRLPSPLEGSNWQAVAEAARSSLPENQYLARRFDEAFDSLRDHA